mmetsp:Transcript_28228/g.79283  ORF Transcript_28228/g.79283 Transcript_28228/m.79283 type:complete len:184 (-) Transcript_28228:1665-2216(-)
MPTGTSVPFQQDWGAVNVGRGTIKKTAAPKTARALDLAKASGKVATEKRCVRAHVADWQVGMQCVLWLVAERRLALHAPLDEDLFSHLGSRHQLYIYLIFILFICIIAFAIFGNCSRNANDRYILPIIIITTNADMVPAATNRRIPEASCQHASWNRRTMSDPSPRWTNRCQRPSCKLAWPRR